ncbi:hypothetical protein [Paenibacillus campi]|nr:hypothetical protein [Paenibacillus sp. SGZ-1009]
MAAPVSTSLGSNYSFVGYAVYAARKLEMVRDRLLGNNAVTAYPGRHEWM